MVRRPYYIGITVLFAFNIAILAASRAELLTSELPTFVFKGIALLALFVAARRLLNQSDRPAVSLVRAHYVVEGLFFLHIAWLNLRMLNHLSMMLPFPYADQLLAGWDQALSLDWMTYFNAVISQPFLFQVLDTAYTSLTFLSFVVLLLLISQGHILRAREFIETFVITAVVCIVIGAAFPARAAVLTLVPDLSVLAHIGWVPGSYHIPYLEALRDPFAPVRLDPDNMPGLATFPSFHTASGILVIWACRKTWLSIPAWAYSIVMISATPVLGGHYLVDLIAGCLVALMVIKLVHFFNTSRGVLPQKRPEPACTTA